MDYLDITPNLNDGSYKPYRKPNATTIYINKESNHPPNIINQIPSAIEKRISSLSSSKEIFDKSKKYYEGALAKSGFNAKLNYQPPQDNPNNPNKKKKRTRKVL